MADITCPQCGSDAFNYYGRTKSGKQRHICLVCNRQFVNGISDDGVDRRPTCPVCGNTMYIYKRERGTIRFRCSRYPGCRGYSKIAKES